ncbi:MAG TPA: peptide-methionine (S)-S-oxide reductase, partial [Nitrospira sp.]
MMVSRWTVTLLLAAFTALWGGNVGLPGGHAADTGATAKAYFAGGCFWCMEEAFEKVTGVLEVVSGYMGGTVKQPGYEEVSSGRTGHAESVEVRYDP